MYLQRHGESKTNVEQLFTCRRLDPGLTVTGREQVEERAAFYTRVGIQRIISSPSLRAVQSAEILGEACGLNITTDEALLEVDLGELEGKSQNDTEYMHIFFNTLHDWLQGNANTRFPGGESGNEVENRIESILALASSTTLLVGHATFFALLMGKTGMQFGKTEDLFLPCAGIAHYTKETDIWDMIGKAEHIIGPDNPAPEGLAALLSLTRKTLRVFLPATSAVAGQFRIITEMLI
jgi:broad specificity phosphatase PhoE